MFIFTGQGAVSQLARMATPTLFRHVLVMTGLVSAPRLLEQAYRWDRPAGDEAAQNASGRADGS